MQAKGGVWRAVFGKGGACGRVTVLGCDVTGAPLPNTSVVHRSVLVTSLASTTTASKEPHQKRSLI